MFPEPKKSLSTAFVGWASIGMKDLRLADHLLLIDNLSAERSIRYARKLIDAGHAYYCFCSQERLDRVRKEQLSRKENPRYDGLCRRLDPGEASQRVKNGEQHVVRFKVPHTGSITAHDLLRGDISVDNSALDDSVIIKSDGLALYHLAAMVDDHIMGITHVIRGSEWLSTFPLHVHIIRAFGWQEPQWVHLSVFLKPSGKGKMSKREASQLVQDGHSIFLNELEDLGYIPEGVVNWVALMGWSYDDKTEFFTLADLIEKFNLEHLNPSPAAINFTKLDYFNGLHIRNLSHDDLAQRLAPYIVNAGYQLDEDILYQAVPVIRERLVTLDDVIPVAGFFFKETVSPNPDRLVAADLSPTETADVALKIYQILAALPEMRKNLVEPPIRNYVTVSGLKAGQVLGLLRKGQVKRIAHRLRAEIIKDKVFRAYTNVIKIPRRCKPDVVHCLTLRV
jgi:glutamyl-tRNA synthetase